VYLDETVDMKIETLNDYDTVPNHCPTCDCEMDEIYCRSEKTESDPVFDLIVYRCPECKAAYACWIEDSYADPWFDLAGENENPTTNTYPLGKNNEQKTSKKCIARYLESISTHDRRNRELDRLIQKKLPTLYATGLSLTTIDFARRTVIDYSKNHNSSSKSLAKLLAAAIYIKANSTTTNGGLWKHKGEGISERRLEEIFGVSRKTIRKWARLLA